MTARAMAYLMIIGGLRSARPGRRGAGRLRAAPVFRSAAGARAALIEATRSRGMEASGPCRSATKERKRAVLVSPRALATCGEGTAWNGEAGGAAAGGDRAFGQDPGAEPGQG